jgi:hypothetical protein
MDERTSLIGSLDRELQAALAVDPSAEFLARVRQRIEREPVPARWWRRPELAVLAAGFVLAAGVWNLPGRSEIAVQPVPTPLATNEPVVEADASPSPPLDPARSPGPRRAAAAGTASPRTSVAAPAPEDRFAVVILAENERVALRMLGAATRIEPPEPPEITVSTERAASARPALLPVSFDAPDLGPPVFEAVSLE